MLKKNNRILTAVFSVTGIVFLSKILGFVKQIVVASVFGATRDTDLISLAEGITVNVEYVIAQSLITAFVPIYIRVKSEDKLGGADFTSEALKTCTALIGLFAIAVFVCAPLLAKIIAPSYDAELSRKLVFYLRIFAPLLILYTVQSVFHAVLNANERFVPGQLIGLNQSVILIVLALLLGKTLGVRTLVIGFFAYSVYNACFLGVFARNLWGGHKTQKGLSENIRELFRMIGPLLVGYAVVFVNQQVDKIIVSGMKAGTVTAMSYGATLSNFVTTLIGTICTVLYTRMSSQAATGEKGEASRFADRASSILVSACLPISILTIIYAKDIVSIVFQRGAFDSSATVSAASALAGYGFVFVPFALKAIFSRFQYGYKNTRVPMINNSIGIACNIVLSLSLYKSLGVFGVTLASSVAELVSAVLNIISAKKLDSTLQLREMRKCLPIWLIGGGMCTGIAVLCSKLLLTHSVLLRFLIACGASLTIYAVVFLPVALKMIKNKG